MDDRLIYRLDALAAISMSVALLLWARPLTTLAGWPLSPAFLFSVGLFLFPWVGFNAWMSVQPSVPLRGAMVHLAVDGSWVIGSGALLLAHRTTMSNVSIGLVMVQAGAVLGVFALKLRGVVRPQVVHR